MTTEQRKQPDQEALVEAIGAALPGYDFTAEEWFQICITLRLQSRGSNLPGPTRLFFEDVARAADAMHNRLNGSPDYLGKEELDAVLGPREA